MYSRILVAVDESAPARAALSAALDLAKVHGAAVHVVNVADLFALYGTESDSADMGDEDARASGQRIIDDSLDALRRAGVRGEGEVLTLEKRPQRICELVVDAARRHAADLLVIGAHSHPRLHPAFIGSVADGVSRLSPVPVLMVRECGTAS